MKLLSTKMKLGIISITGSLLLLVIGFNNCSKVAVSDLKESASGELVVPTGNPVDPGDLTATCQNARALGKLRVAKFQKTFEDTNQQCEWGVNGNLSSLNGYVRARKDQAETFTVATTSSPQATICNVMMSSNEVSNFYYDDNVILTLNGFILASTTNFNRHFESSNGYYKYSWDRLVGKDAQNAGSDTTADKQYCAGASQGISQCQFPLTEQTGTAELQFGEKAIQAILGMTSSKQINLGVTTTGDNDPATDCQHVSISLSIDVEYIAE